MVLRLKISRRGAGHLGGPSGTPTFSSEVEKGGRDVEPEHLLDPARLNRALSYLVGRAGGRLFIPRREGKRFFQRPARRFLMPEIQLAVTERNPRLRMRRLHPRRYEPGCDRSFQDSGSGS